MTKEKIIEWLNKKNANILDVDGFDGGVVCEFAGKKDVLGTIFSQIGVYRIGADQDDKNSLAYMPVISKKETYEQEYQNQLCRLRECFNSSTKLKGQKWNKTTSQK